MITQLSLLLALFSGAIDANHEEVHFTNAGITFGGTVVIPQGQVKAGMVCIHGSGASTRYDFLRWSNDLAAKGIATFCYDKRGCGESGGDWRFSTLQDLAGDADAALASLAKRVSGAPLGLFSASQGPWVASIVSGRNKSVKFMVNISGGPVNVGDQEAARRTLDAKNLGAPAGVAKKIITTYFTYLTSNGTQQRSELDALCRQYNQANWYKALSMADNPALPGEWPPLRKAFASDLGQNFTEKYAQLKIPVLALLGQNDQVMPPTLLEQKYRDTFSGERAKLLTLKVIPGANHQLSLGGGALAPGVLESIADWVLHHAR